MSTCSTIAPHVLLLGVGRLGSEVASRLLDDGEGKLVGIVARDRGAFDARGLSRTSVNELLRQRSSSVERRLDFPAPDVFLAMLARLSWPLLVDCTGADGASHVYADAGRRGIRVASAAWLSPRPSLRSAARAMLRDGHAASSSIALFARAIDASDAGCTNASHL